MRRLSLCVVVAWAVLGCGGDPESDEPHDAGLGEDAAPSVDVVAEEVQSPIPDAEAEQEAGVAVRCDVDPQRVYEDVERLASPALAGRAPGTPGNEEALAYAESVFLESGLTPAGLNGSFRQPFQHVVWGLFDTPSVALGDNEAEPGTEFTVFAQSGTVDVTAEIVFVGYGMTMPAYDPSTYPNCPLDPAGYDDYAGIDADGKIVLVMRHGPGDLAAVHDGCPASAPCSGTSCLWSFDYKVQNARLHGAAAAVFVPHDPQAPGVIDAYLSASSYASSFASVFVERGVVSQAVPELSGWQETIDTTLQPSSTATGITGTVRVSAAREAREVNNLLGLIPGTDPRFEGEVVMVGAHIDHLGATPLTGTVYPGADDNASGSAVVLELARALGGCLAKPARSVALAIWNAEEDGLVGSCHFAKNPTIPLNQIHALLNVDMVGGGNGTGIHVIAGDLWNQNWVFDVLEGSAQARGLGWDVVAAPPYGGSDHVCFYNAGTVAVSVQTLGPHLYYHTPNDTVENVEPKDLAAASEVLIAALQSFAEGSEQQHVRCAGACRDQVHDACTCDPSDPCKWSNDGVCDDACEQVAGEVFDDSLDCKE
jgi:hypothetical protein